MAWKIAAYLVLPGGFVAAAIAVGVWLRKRWLSADAARVDALIDQNRAKPVDGMKTHDEGLRQTTEQRRAIADRMRRRAAHVESGSASGEVVRLKERR
ncbi:MAG TPA: hypothetical protein VEU08_17165 [Vicinamibacterales bacterium]|nr:hypothetical protein [Vicinamibacterales bacterium]